MCRRAPPDRCAHSKRSRDRQVVSRIGQQVCQLLREPRIGPPAVAVTDEGAPGHRSRSGWQWEQLGHWAAAHRHPEAFAVLDPTKHGADVVSKLACRDIGHDRIVAALLRYGRASLGCSSKKRSAGAVGVSAWRSESLPVPPSRSGSLAQEDFLTAPHPTWLLRPGSPPHRCTASTNRRGGRHRPGRCPGCSTGPLVTQTPVSPSGSPGGNSGESLFVKPTRAPGRALISSDGGRTWLVGDPPRYGRTRVRFVRHLIVVRGGGICRCLGAGRHRHCALQHQRRSQLAPRRASYRYRSSRVGVVLVCQPTCCRRHPFLALFPGESLAPQPSS